MIADERSVREFLETFIALATASLGGHPPPGVLQTSRKFPDDNDLVPSRYTLDHPDVVERMTEDALADCEAGANVYIEGRLLKPLRGRKRGELNDTACVFALAVDSDADKNMAWVPPFGVRPTLIVETSPGNHQFWFFFATAVSPARAQAAGEGLRKITRGDCDTGNPCQPYRIGGTVNYVSKIKMARGRIVTPTLFLGAAL